MYWYYVVYIMYYVLSVVYYVLCVMYYVLCMMRCVLCIMYYRLYIAIHGLSGSWPPQVPESPAGVGSRLAVLRGCGGRPMLAEWPSRAGAADRPMYRKSRGSLRIGSGMYCKMQYSRTMGSPKHRKIRYIHSRYIAGQVSWLEGLLAACRRPPAGCQPAASRL